MSDPKTGLGTAALYQTPKKKATKSEDTEGEPKRKKTSTSMRLYVDTVVLLEACQIHTRKTTGKKMAVSDILDEALREWAEKRNVVMS